MPLSDTVTAVWMFVRWLFAGMAWVVERILLMTRRKDLNLNSFIRVIPDFPKQGILFRDITPLLGNPLAFREVVHRMAEAFAETPIDAIVAAEARGFIFAAPMALELNASFIPVRKPGKLPHHRHSFSYDLEYGQDTLEMHKDAIHPGQRVLVVDDLLATGGTVGACIRLLEETGAVIAGCAFCIELKSLRGREKLGNYPIHSVLSY
jgi:adenine phosphoribosyltransferase